MGEAKDSGSASDAVRLPKAGRRDALLDAAAELVGSGEVDDVSMEAVAELAGVSRALVYKHFANRQHLLGALYERETAVLHEELATAVMEAGTLADMLRALVRGVLSAQATRGATLAALRSRGGASTAQRKVQRERDSQTLRFFTRQAMREFGLDEPRARSGVALVLGAIQTVLARWRLQPTDDHAQLLEDTYVALAIGGLRELAGAG